MRTAIIGLVQAFKANLDDREACVTCQWYMRRTLEFSGAAGGAWQLMRLHLTPGDACKTSAISSRHPTPNDRTITVRVPNARAHYETFARGALQHTTLFCTVAS